MSAPFSMYMYLIAAAILKWLTGFSVCFQMFSLALLLFEKEGLKERIGFFFFSCVNESRLICFLVFFTTGCPPCLWRCNRHGDGALHPGRCCLRHQSLLLWFHPERNQVHLPQEVRTCPPIVLEFCCFKCFLVWLCFVSVRASLFLHSHIDFLNCEFLFVCFCCSPRFHCHGHAYTHCLLSLLFYFVSCHRQWHIVFVKGSAPPQFDLSLMLSATESRVL